MERSKRVLILYTSVGLGHQSIAENIGATLSRAGFEVRLLDILKVQAGWLVSVSTRIHRFINEQLPWLWSWLYSSRVFTDLTLPLRVPLAARNSRETKFAVDEFAPDLIITTQTTASAVVAYLKRRGYYTGPFGIAFSDFHLHRYWLYPEADFYLANIEEQKTEMAALGFDPDRVYVCGIALRDRPEVSARAVRQRLNISEADKVVLVSSGSQGLGLGYDLLDQLAARRNVKTVVVCGKNQEAFSRLSDRYAGTGVVVLGFHTPMDELYAIADVFVTKPGGLSTAEALRWGTPMLISHLLPGQEEYNYSYLIERGLVLPEPVNLLAAVEEELKDGAFKAALAQNPARNALLPNAAEVLRAAGGLPPSPSSHFGAAGPV